MEIGVMYKLKKYGLYDEIPLETSAGTDFMIDIMDKVFEDSHDVDQVTKNNLDIAYSFIKDGRLDRARDALDFFLKDIEANNDFSGDEETEFRTFNEQFEYSMRKHCLERSGVSKEIRSLNIRLSDIYLVNALIAVELGDKETAAEDYENALRWNPVNSRILDNYFLLCWSEGDFDKAYELLVQRLDTAFRRSDVADCYTKLGLLFRKKEHWLNAYKCFDKAVAYEEDEDKELDLRSLMNPLLDILAPDEMLVIALPEDGDYDCEYEFPEVDIQEIAQMAYEIGGYYLVIGEYDRIEPYWKIALDLTHSDDISDLLKMLHEGRIQDLLDTCVQY